MVGGEDHGPALGHVLAADPRQPEVEVEERLEERPHEPVDERVDAALAVARVQVGVIGRRLRVIGGRSLHEPYSLPRAVVTVAAMAFDATRTLRGALAGAAAAAVWAAQQPLDKRVFGVDYDDAELLGRLARVRAPATHPVGLALHVANGAVFGALYANVAPSLPGPGAARGAAAGLAEHLATWPGTLVIDRLSARRATSRSCGATRARSRRRRGGTCSSARCSASSSGG